MEPMIIAMDVVGENAGVAWKTTSAEAWIPIEDRKPSSALLPALASCFSQGVPEKLGVIVGPGSFTGIRTGIATALGLKMSRKLKIFGFHKFELMAFAWDKSGVDQATFLIPNRGERFYACRWEKATGLKTPEEVHLKDLHACPALVTTRPIEGHEVSLIEQPLPKICLEALEENLGDPALVPLYIRPADTRTNLTYIEKLLAKGAPSK